MCEEERDIVEFEDEDGNKLELEVLDTFFYNGEEFAVLGEPEDECACEDEEEGEGEACSCGCEECAGECDCGHDHSLYIMKIVPVTGENGEEMEEFIPVEDSMMDKLIEIVQTRFSEDDDDLEDEEDEEEEDKKDE